MDVLWDPELKMCVRNRISLSTFYEIRYGGSTGPDAHDEVEEHIEHGPRDQRTFNVVCGWKENE